MVVNDFNCCSFGLGSLDKNLEIACKLGKACSFHVTRWCSNRSKSCFVWNKWCCRRQALGPPAGLCATYLPESIISYNPVPTCRWSIFDTVWMRAYRRVPKNNSEPVPSSLGPGVRTLQSGARRAWDSDGWETRSCPSDLVDRNGRECSTPTPSPLPNTASRRSSCSLQWMGMMAECVARRSDHLGGESSLVETDIGQHGGLDGKLHCQHHAVGG